MSDIEPMDRGMRALLRRGAPAVEAPDAAKARVLAAVTEILAGSFASGTSGVPEAPRDLRVGAADPAVSPLAAAKVVALWKAAALAAFTFALGGGVGAALISHDLARADLPSSDRARVSVKQAASAPEPGPARVQAAPIASTDPPPAVLRAEDLPNSRVERAATARSAGVSPHGSLVAERRLLDDARLAFGRGEPAACSALLDRHARMHPRGALSEEREALRVRAVAASGRDAEARALAAQFRTTYPESLLGPAVQAALDGGPPSRPSSIP